MRPHRRQPTRFPRPWDSPGKNTGVGCHFLLQCMKVKSESEVAQSCLTLSDPIDCSQPDSFIHEIFQARVLEWGAITLGSIKWWELTQRKPLEYKTQHHPTTSSTLFRTPPLNNKQTKIQIQYTGLPRHSALPIRGKTNKQKLSTDLTLCQAYTNYWTKLRRAETKRMKEFNLKPWQGRP